MHTRYIPKYYTMINSRQICVLFFILIPSLSNFTICDEVLTDSPRVEISSGKLVGTFEFTRENRKFKQFLGIPYGHVEKRFDISVPAKSWNGTRFATNSGPGCARYALSNRQFYGVEDCLTLDVSSIHAR
ncbi:Esterase SG1 [Folsomia candida]|uniref:Esterase SG1 n=1 Tax=Folsomia candida TaxID=158441 RepID=A0A226DG69_FOLCA|nr:Esterase SG1 [Folsomia candida]